VPEKPLRVLGIGDGRSIHLLRWARHLLERGHDVFVLSDRDTALLDADERLETRDVRDLDIVMRIPLLRRPRFGPAIRTFAGRFAPDVVHAHYLLPYGYWAARARVHPLVVSPWGTDVLVHGRERPAGRERARAALRAADLVIVNSDALESASLELGAPQARTRRVLWHLDLAPFGPERANTGVRARLGWPDDALVLLSLRRFREDMNLDVLVRAFARLSAEEPAARLILAGAAGPERPRIQELASQLALGPAIAFVAAAEGELPGLVAAADLAVSLARSDSAPPSLLEAMASGLPVVCAEAASIGEWVGAGEGAEIVPQRDVEATAAAILRLLRDPDLRRRYGERNRHVVSERVEPPGPALESLYRELAG
jgi:glycosyltransferase involved in cell wall biosynthesis